MQSRRTSVMTFGTVRIRSVAGGPLGGVGWHRRTTALRSAARRSQARLRSDGRCRRSSPASSTARSRARSCGATTAAWRSCRSTRSRPGHTLVVPIEEVDHWIDLAAELVAHLFDGRPRDRPGPAAGLRPRAGRADRRRLEVPHVHLHVIPTTSMSRAQLRQRRRARSTRRARRGGRALRAELRPLGRAEVGLTGVEPVRRRARAVACSTVGARPRSIGGRGRPRRRCSSGALVADVVHLGRHRVQRRGAWSGAGTSSSPSDSRSWLPGSSHVVPGRRRQDHRHPVVDRRHRLVGRRSVMIVHECSARRVGPAGFGSRHVSHSPAKASGSPSRRWMKYGCLPLALGPRRLLATRRSRRPG